jgi:excisionase family DNA binding protein
VQYLTVTEAASVARCHPETIREALRDGSLRGSQRKKGGPWKITRAALDAWVGAEAVAA